MICKMSDPVETEWRPSILERQMEGLAIGMTPIRSVKGCLSFQGNIRNVPRPRMISILLHL